MLQSSNKSNIDAEFDFGYKKYIKDRMYKRKDASDSDSEVEKDGTTDFGEIKEKLTGLTDQPESEKPGNEIITNNDNKQKKGKTSVKSNPKKQKATHNITATSSWSVVPLDVNNTVGQAKPSSDILEEFETLETNLNDKVKRKLSELKQNLQRLEDRRPVERSNIKTETTVEVGSLEYLKIKENKIKPIIDEELNETNTRHIKSAIDKGNNITNATVLVNKNRLQEMMILQIVQQT